MTDLRALNVVKAPVDEVVEQVGAESACDGLADRCSCVVPHESEANVNDRKQGHRRYEYEDRCRVGAGYGAVDELTEQERRHESGGRAKEHQDDDDS